MLRILTTCSIALALLAWMAMPAPAADKAQCKTKSCCSMAMAAGMTCAKCNPNVHARINKPASAFALNDANGKEFKLAAEKGKVIVLVWTNPGCPFIQRHYREGTLNRLVEKNDPNQVVFFQIDSTKGGDAKRELKVSEEYKLKPVVLMDPESTIARIYQAKTTPDVFVINKHGKLIYRGAIDNDPASKMSSSERENYVEEAIQAALQDQVPKRQTTKPYGCSVKYAKKVAKVDSSSKSSG